MNWRDRVAELRQSVWLALLDAREARDVEASERLKAWTDELDVLLHPPQYCERALTDDPSPSGPPVVVLGCGATRTRSQRQEWSGTR
jgi:hypothetical protein